MQGSILHRLAALMMLLSFGVAAAQDHNEPVAVVENLHAHLLDAMQRADTLGFRGRSELLNPVVDASFDFPTIAGIVTARHWKSLGEGQRADFLKVFAALSTATYASNFSGYSGERFETIETADSRGAKIVRTQIVTGDGEKIPLNYMLRENNGEWRIINVVAQGVSDLSLKRAEYTAVIENEGFDSLVKRLRGKVSQMDQ